MVATSYDRRPDGDGGPEPEETKVSRGVSLYPSTRRAIAREAPTWGLNTSTALELAAGIWLWLVRHPDEYASILRAMRDGKEDAPAETT